MQAQLDNNVDVNNFCTTVNPSVDIIAKAYFARDEIMKISFNDSKKNSLKKLRLLESIVDSDVKLRFKKYLYSLVDNFINNTNINVECNFSVEYSKYINSEEVQKVIKERKSRFEQLNQINDHLEFYQSMTKGELEYLGW